MASSKPSHFIHLETASEWFAVLSDESASAAEREAWRQWLEADAEHRKAWQQVESVGAMFSAFQGQNVHRSAAHVLSSSQTREVSRRQLMKGVMGMAGIASLGWLGWQQTPLPSMVTAWSADFHTMTGEVSQFELDDGSKVWLNTNSAMNRTYTSTLRQLSLLEGEAFLAVNGESDSRLFSIACEQAILTSTGLNSRFCVRHLANQQAILAVYEGAISLAPLASHQVIEVRAGEQVVFNDTLVDKITSVSAIHESWTRGLLVVDDMTLSDFVAEVGRYRHGYINLDPSIASLRVIGTYPAQDASLVFDMLENAFPIRIKRLLPWWTSISAA
ncbi:DUF4880 domain-containing protein [Marinomonas transparens]|uniref:FecR domain-containing protein n=1 Tax=Marinomonas transparens TaxID=2795388 RepID=A0A934JQR2_9GAMM|nr:DUF4880 domain-containing protein [Marinomonas transparens]MBJ7538948.1 FecR domain-containing protein [Marinomonas transparens]